MKAKDKELFNKSLQASKTEIENLLKFVYNATIKYGEKYDLADDNISSFLSGLLFKYFDEGLTAKEVYQLKTFSDKYNNILLDRFLTHPMKNIVGLNHIDDNIDNSVFRKIINHIYSYLNSYSNDLQILAETARKDYEDALKNNILSESEIDNLKQLSLNAVNKYETNKSVLSRFKKSNILEGLVLIQISRYLEAYKHISTDDPAEDFTLGCYVDKMTADGNYEVSVDSSNKSASLAKLFDYENGSKILYSQIPNGIADGVQVYDKTKSVYFNNPKSIISDAKYIPYTHQDEEFKFLKASANTNNFSIVYTYLNLPLVTDDILDNIDLIPKNNHNIAKLTEGNDGEEIFYVSIPLVDYILDTSRSKKTLTPLDGQTGDYKTITGITLSDVNESYLTKLLSNKSYFYKMDGNETYGFGLLNNDNPEVDAENSGGLNIDLVSWTNPKPEVGKYLYNKISEDNLMFSLPDEMVFYVNENSLYQSASFTDHFIYKGRSGYSNYSKILRKKNETDKVNEAAKYAQYAGYTSSRANTNNGYLTDSLYSYAEIADFLYKEIYMYNDLYKDGNLYSATDENFFMKLVDGAPYPALLSSISELIDYYIEAEILKKMIIQYIYKLANNEKTLKMTASLLETEWSINNYSLCPINIRGYEIYEKDDNNTLNAIYSEFIDSFTKRIYRKPINAGDAIYEDIALYTISETTTNNTLSSSKAISYNYLSFYKEFNTEYRNVLLSDIGDIFMVDFIQSYGAMDYFDSKKSIPSFIVRTADEDILMSLQTNYKDPDTEQILHLLDSENDIIFTNYYAHPYYIRKAPNHSIVSFLYGKYLKETEDGVVIKSGYGSTNSEVLEIKHYLEIFKSVREYFYKTLYNKAFNYSENYDLFILNFIIFWSIEKMLTSKVDNLKDPDYMTSTDISNFLRSYGLEQLDEARLFYDKEQWNKNIILRFNELLQWKGSKNVIDLIAQIFSDGDTTIDLFKYLLVEDTSDMYNDEKDEYEYNIENRLNMLAVYEDGSIEDLLSQIKSTTAINILKDSNITLPTEQLKKSRAANNGLSYIVYDTENSDKTIYEILSLLNVEGSEILSKIKEEEANNSFSSQTKLSNILSFSGDVKYTKTLQLSNGTKCTVYITTISVLKLHMGERGDGNIYAYLPVYNNLSEIIENKEWIGSNFTVNAQPLTISPHSYLPIKKVFSAYSFNIGKILTNMVAFAIDAQNNHLYGFDGADVVIPRFSTVETKIVTLNNKPVLIGLGQVVCENEVTIDDKLLIDSLLSTNGMIDGYVEVIKFAESYNPSYKFVKINYQTNSAVKDVINSLATSFKYETFIADDKYWSIDNTKETDLNDRNVHYSLTKYLDVAVSQNIYQSLIRAKYILSMMDYLILTTTGNWLGKTGKDDQGNLVSEPFYINQTSDGTIDLLNKLVFTGIDENISKATMIEIYTVVRALYSTLNKLYNLLYNKEFIDEQTNLPEMQVFMDTGVSGYNPDGTTNYTNIKYNGFNVDLFINTEETLKNSKTFKFLKDNFNLTDSDLIGLSDYFKNSDEISLNNVSLDELNSKCGYFEKLLYNKNKNTAKRIFYIETQDDLCIGTDNGYMEGSFIGPLMGIDWVPKSKYIDDLINSSKLFDEVIDGDGASSDGYVIEMFQNLNWLLLKNQYLTGALINYLSTEDKLEEFNQASLYSNKELSSHANLVIGQELFTKILKFPIDYSNGIFNPEYSKYASPATGNYTNSNLFINNKFREFVDLFYDDFYMTKYRPYYGYETFDTILEKNISGIKESDHKIVPIYTSGKNEPTNVDRSSTLDAVRIAESARKIDGDYNSLLVYIYENLYGVINNSEFEGDINISFSNQLNLDAITDQEFNNEVTKMSEKIISLTSTLNEVYSILSNMQLSFLLSSEQTNTLSYLKDVIKLFISYTSMLYNTSYSLTYKTPAESVPLSESLNVDHSYIFTDNLFYDTRAYITDSEIYTLDEVRR